MIVALCTDLMDRSRIAGALDGVRIVGPSGDLSGASVVLVDLALSGALDSAVAHLADHGGRGIAYGSHVDEEALAEARRRGVEALPRSVFFRRLGEGTLIEPAGT